MKLIDRILQRWRFRVGLKCLGTGLRVIDVGAHRGELFRALGDRLRCGFGIDPLCSQTVEWANCTIHPGRFPSVRPAEGEWDAITMFAVLEHIPQNEQRALADACHDLLRAGGQVVATVPARAVDGILEALIRLRLIDGMSTEEHDGFEPTDALAIFSEPRFRLLRHRRFQFGLNHLFVFERIPPATT